MGTGCPYMLPGDEAGGHLGKYTHIHNTHIHIGYLHAKITRGYTSVAQSFGYSYP